MALKPRSLGQSHVVRPPRPPPTMDLSCANPRPTARWSPSLKNATRRVRHRSIPSGDSKLHLRARAGPDTFGSASFTGRGGGSKPDRAAERTACLLVNRRVGGPKQGDRSKHSDPIATVWGRPLDPLLVLLVGLGAVAAFAIAYAGGRSNKHAGRGPTAWPVRPDLLPLRVKVAKGAWPRIVRE